MIHYFKGEYHEGTVGMNPAEPGFRYGAGVMETILYNGERLCRAGAHLDRLDASLRELDAPMEPADLQEIMMEVVRRNELEGLRARVNIFCPIEGGRGTPVVLAARYQADRSKIFRLTRHPEFHVSPLCRHKTMNYLFFNMARQRAASLGFDDAVLCDHEGNLLETTTAALLFRQGDTFFETRTKFKLPSTSLAAVREVFDVEKREISVDDLNVMDNAYVLNSLMGMRPVESIGRAEFQMDTETCEKGSDAVFG